MSLKQVGTILFLLLAALPGNSETGFSRDSLRVAIRFLENQKPSVSRDSALSIYYNELIEKLNYGNLPDVNQTLKTFQAKQKNYLWPVSQAFVLRAEARIHEKQGDYVRSIEEYHEAILQMEKAAYKGEQLAYTYVLLAYAVLNNGDDTKAWNLFEKSLEISRNVADKSIQIWALDFFGDQTLFHGRNQSHYLKALDYYKQVEALLPKSRVENQIPNNLQGQANVYELLGNEQMATIYREKALEYSLNLPVPNYFNVYEVYRDWATFESSKGRAAEAVMYQKKALQAAENFGFLEIINRACYSLYQYQKLAGTYPEALTTLETYTRLEDSLKRTEVNKKYAELDKKYEFEKHQSKIRELENQNLKYGLIALLITLLAGGIALATVQHSKKKIMKLNEGLAGRNAAVEEALYEGKRLERRRVSDRLHDHIATKISALKWKVEARENEMDQGIYRFLVSQLSVMYEDIRGMAHELRPLEFLDKGLRAATCELFRDLEEKMTADFEVTVGSETDTLDKSLQYHVYQFVLELCTNLKRHATPTRVVFLLDANETHLHLYLANDGFSSPHLKEGQGLRNIRKKVSENKGTLILLKDRFFSVEIRIPLTDETVT